MPFFHLVKKIDFMFFGLKVIKTAQSDIYSPILIIYINWLNYYIVSSSTQNGGLELRGHSSAVTDVLFSHHNPLLFSVSHDLTMRAWKASDYTCAAVYRGHNFPIWCVSESSNGMYLATGSKDTTARLWSTEREFPVVVYIGHTQDIDVSFFVFTSFTMNAFYIIFFSLLPFIQMEIT